MRKGELPDNPEELTAEGEGWSPSSDGEGGKKIPEDPGEPEWNPEVNSLLSKADGREKRKDTDHSRKKWKWGFPGCRRE